MAKPKTPGAAESKTLDGITWLASRPAVLPFLIEAKVCGWGVYVTFHGTEAELIAAGLATGDMFENMGKSGQRTRETGYGDRYIVKKRRGKWDLEIHTCREVGGVPSDEYPQPSAWWLKHGGDAEAETRKILASLRKGATRARQPAAHDHVWVEVGPADKPFQVCDECGERRP